MKESIVNKSEPSITNRDYWEKLNVKPVYYKQPKQKKINPFSVGDIVVLKTGTSHKRVTLVNGDMVEGQYILSNYKVTPRPYTSFNLVTAETEKKETEMSNKLYKTITTNRYGEYRAKDGGNILLFMSDTNLYEPFKPEDIKRVMPFTFDVMFAGTGKVFSYLGIEGEVAVGDFLLGDSLTIAQVVAVNTESEGATSKFVGAKLASSPLKL